MKILLAILLFAVSAFGQATFSNLDDSLTGWQYNPPCEGPACAGGSAFPTTTTMSVGNAMPSMDGQSAKFSMTAAAQSNPSLTTNVLWPRKVGANNTYTTFVGTYHVYIPSIFNITALEFDQFQFNQGERYMFGSECDKGGIWRIWNQLTGEWVTTSAPCTIFTANAWHSIVWTTHRVPGDLNMYYDSLVVDGVTYSGFTPQPSAKSTDGDNNGIQFQIDESAAGGTVNVFVDEMSLSLEVPSSVTSTVISGLTVIH